jgi:hypothetical protein
MPIKKAVVKKRGRPKMMFVPRNEQEVLKKIDDWCIKCHPHVKV